MDEKPPSSSEYREPIQSASSNRLPVGIVCGRSIRSRKVVAIWHPVGSKPYLGLHYNQGISNNAKEDVRG